MWGLELQCLLWLFSCQLWTYVSTFKSFFQPFFWVCRIIIVQELSLIVKLNFCGSQSQSNSGEVETRGSTFINEYQHLHSKFYMHVLQNIASCFMRYLSFCKQLESKSLKIWKFGKRFELSYYYELSKLGKSQWNIELPIKRLFCYYNTFLVCITSFKGL